MTPNPDLGLAYHSPHGGAKAVVKVHGEHRGQKDDRHRDIGERDRCTKQQRQPAAAHRSL